MKRTALAVAAATALLLLAGCTSSTTTETVTVTPGAAGTYSDGDTTVEVQPLTAETPAVADDEAVFLDTVRAKLRPDNVIPSATDEQLLAAGEEACAEIAAGTPTDQLSVIDGEPTNALGTFSDSAVIVTAAATTICG
ncbi:hypothetical protein B0I12_002565 [Microbacterium hydrothermale]|uniref:DUF732 domain-containing protein n=1 Tax=Microbacterium hydrothermale TaxID=857427 RepID=UPI0022264187|nr:DUF732 domain-containing protein [Microbacterium hydrothermale]MCW2165410.1 hypothetical protein [Microbacterium hydrothermale]